ncbi:MBL fold metallo-hydrolase [Candidatus Woesearchaeota archaeon]|nr:MBL fold metallo-hydrolase [Candidatus Woesearchaeota archaeon]
MIIKTFIGNPIETNTYLVVDEASKKAMVIDPSGETIDEILKQGFKITYIVNTHGHWDHITENSKLKKLTNAKILVHEKDADMLENTENPYMKVEPSKADGFFKDKLKLGNLTFKIIHTPGHTKGSVCLYEEKEKIIFTGDILFKGAHGRTDFDGGSEQDIIESLKRLRKLPENVIVYPGHGEKTTIKKEKNWLDSYS